MTSLLKCGKCEGYGWVYKYDGVGGRWKDRCRQCDGVGKVEIQYGSMIR